MRTVRAVALVFAAVIGVCAARADNNDYPTSARADYVFGCDWDVMSDVTKSRRFGFHDVVDSEEMFVSLMRKFRAERIVP